MKRQVKASFGRTGLVRVVRWRPKAHGKEARAGDGARYADRIRGVRTGPARTHPPARSVETGPRAVRCGAGLPGRGAGAGDRRARAAGRLGPAGGRAARPRRRGVARLRPFGAASLMGGASVRGHRSLAGGLGAPGRRGQAAESGEGAVRPGGAGAGRDAGANPHARRGPAGRARQGDRPAARRAGRTAGGARVCAERRRAASRRVRRPRRCGGRVPRDRAPARPARILGGRGRVAARVRPVLATVLGPARPSRDPRGARAGPRRRAGRAGPPARAQVPRPLPRRARAARRRAVRRGPRVARAAPVRRDAAGGRAAPRGFVGRGRGRAADVRPGEPDPRRRQRARRRLELARPGGGPLAGGGAGGSGPAPPDWLHRGDRPRDRGMGDRAGQPRRARTQGHRAARARVPDPVDGARPRVARAHPRVRRAAGGRDRRGRARGGVRVPGGQAGGRDRGGPVRLAAPHARGAAVHQAHQRRDRRRARDRRLRRAPGPRRRSVRGRAAPCDRRLRTRLHGARLRGGGSALGPDRPGRHGRAVSRRRVAAPDASSARSRTWRASS